MDARLTHTMVAQRTAAAQTVAGALAPRSHSSSTLRGAATAAASGSNSTAPTGASDITSSDFLTLLVSELKNQDPTQPTDPNQYITQLAQVNSLEQLISINTGIASLDSAVSTTTPPPDKSASSASALSTLGTVSGAAESVRAADLQPASAPATLGEVHKLISGATTL